MGERWAALLTDLTPMVMKALQATWRRKPHEGGLGFCKATASVSLVCAGWKAAHDALVMRLPVSHLITDEAMGVLVRRFPTVASVDGARVGPPPTLHLLARLCRV
jgi:hypothetical protein